MISPSRLNGLQIVALRTLAKCSGGQPITLSGRFRLAGAHLWRRELIQVWYRQSLRSSLEGPFYSLTISGARLAAAFCHLRETPDSGASPIRGGETS